MPDRYLYYLSVCLLWGVCVGQVPPQWSFSLILSYLFVFILLLLYVGLFGSSVGHIVVRMQYIGLLDDVWLP